MSAKGLNVKRTWGGCEKIDNLIKKEKNARIKERLQAVLWRLENEDYTEISKRLKRANKTITEWVKRWNKSGYEGLIDKPKTGRPVILNQIEKKEVIKEINENNSQIRITCKYLVQEIKKSFNKKISPETVRIFLHKNKISWKKPDKVDYRRDEEKRKLFLENFFKKDTQSA